MVTRYFGGIKLGAGGLVRAYTNSVVHAVEEAGLAQRVEMAVFALSAPPGEAGRIMNKLYNQNIFYGERRSVRRARADSAVHEAGAAGGS